jgi:hypothetical protein
MLGIYRCITYQVFPASTGESIQPLHSFRETAMPDKQTVHVQGLVVNTTVLMADVSNLLPG